MRVRRVIIETSNVGGYHEYIGVTSIQKNSADDPWLTFFSAGRHVEVLIGAGTTVIIDSVEVEKDEKGL